MYLADGLENCFGALSFPLLTRILHTLIGLVRVTVDKSVIAIHRGEDSRGG
jgi:hypothetical protein